MTAPPTLYPRTHADQPATACAIVVELDADDDTALLRVFSLLARRRCRVLRMAFAPETVAGCATLRLELNVPAGLTRNVLAWVSALVPVRSARCA